MKLKGPATSASKFNKSPEVRGEIIAKALALLASAPPRGKSFQKLTGCGRTDRDAYRKALPESHLRNQKFSQAARAAWATAFAAVSAEHPESFRVVKA